MNNLKSTTTQVHLKVQLPKKDPIVKAGTLLLTFKPFAFVLTSTLVHSHCDSCLESSSANKESQLLRCANCHYVKYCDRTCQKNGWTEGHKIECKAIKQYGRFPPSFARLLLRVVVKVQSKIDYCDQVTPLLHRRFKDLMSHYRDVKQDAGRMEQILTFGKVLESILVLHKGFSMPNESDLIGLCGRIMVNSFSIVDSELQQVGTGIYLGASIFDHSCEPMAVASFESTTISVRALIDYPSSLPIERVTICYQDTMRPSMYRIADLKNVYYFECACVRCANKLYDDEMNAIICPNKDCKGEFKFGEINKCPSCHQVIDEVLSNRIKETEEFVREKLSEMHSTAYLDVCEVCLNLMSSCNFAESHWLLASIISCAFDASVNLQRWESALAYGRRALKSYRQYLHPFHPFLGMALLKLAKLTWFLEKEAAAKTYLLEAKRIIDITHGPTSTFSIRQVLPLIKEIGTNSNNPGLPLP